MRKLAMPFVPVLTCLSAFVSISHGGFYLSLVPKVVHPGWPVNVVISIFTKDLPDLVNVNAQLYSSDQSPMKLLDSRTTAMDEGETKLISLSIPQNETSRKYFLKMNSTAGLVFKEHITLTTNENNSIVIVQTDKNIYKPGQQVHFRVVHLNPDLSPLEEPLVVFIKNPKDNKLDMFNIQPAANGVSELNFKMPQFATLGTWSIEVQDINKRFLFNQLFLVDEYVLPKFSVELTPDPNFLVWGIYNQPPAIIVKSLYTYGKPVIGECMLTVKLKSSGAFNQLSRKIPESGIVEFVDINWRDIIGGRPSTQKKLIVIVEVKDVMGRKEVESVTIPVYRGNFKVKILPSSDTILRVGIPAIFHVAIVDHYGNPAVGEQAAVYINMPQRTQLLKERVKIEAGKTYATIQFIPQTGYKSSDNNYIWEYEITGHVKVELVSDPGINDKKDLHWFVSENAQSLKIESPMNNILLPKDVPQDFNIICTSSRDIDLVMYAVVSQGIVLETGLVENKKLTLTPSFAMCPNAQLIVYQVVDKELVADSMNLPIDLCLDKQAKVKFGAREQRTGTDANLEVEILKTDDSSIEGQHPYDIFYLAVDKSIVLLQGDTALTASKVLNRLDSINNWSGEVKGYTTSHIFEDLNLGLVSNVLKKLNFMPDQEIMVAQVEDDGFRRKGPVDPPSENNLKEVESAEPELEKVIRKNFPDTWLWGQGKAINGVFRTQVRLPDTITSWFVTAFGINDDGIVPSGDPFELKAFQPFFVSLNLPYSIKRGEVFSLTVTAFNYRPQEVKAVIRLEINQNFTIKGGLYKDNWMEHTVKTQPNGASSVIYYINATMVGSIYFHVVAQDADDSSQRDEVIKKLKVKSPGERRRSVIADLLVIKEENTPVTKTFNINWPYNEIIEGSQKLTFKVTGQVMGQAFSNLDKLITIPTGCGEQNMIGLVPNIYGSIYINSLGVTDSQKYLEKMAQNMKHGYQRQVDKYKKDDGSYSAWSSDKFGSTWLTAFVIKSFASASKFINVDQAVLEEGLQFLASKQDFDGVFREDGKVLHSEMKKGGKGDLPLTVYCLLSILETKQATTLSYSMTILINRSLNYILKMIPSVKMLSSGIPFLPAMTSYTLSLAKMESEIDLNDTIKELLAYIKDSNPSWSEKSDTNISVELMAASYTLLTSIRENRLDQAIDLMKWLQTKQNSLGGYGSTQDTILILQSLSELGINFKDKTQSGQVTVSILDTDFEETMDISNDRSLLLQMVDLPITADSVVVKLTGVLKTIAVAKVVSTYNTEVTSAIKKRRSVSDSVDITTKTRSLSDAMHEVQTCVSSTLEPGVGMYVASLNLPSGEVPSESIPTMMANNPEVSNIEAEDGTIHFYMDNVPREGYCLKAKIERQMDFSVQLNGSAIFYSYYEPDDHYRETSLVLSNSTCFGTGCGAAALFSVTSVLMTSIICVITSLLSCM